MFRYDRAWLSQSEKNGKQAKYQKAQAPQLEKHQKAEIRKMKQPIRRSLYPHLTKEENKKPRYGGADSQNTER